MVDAGFGALVKRHAEEVQQEWFDEEDNWAEWTGTNLSASRKRVLCTLWYGQAYDRACRNYNFIATFDRTGSNMTCDGSLDHKIKLSGLEDFSFTVDDAKRDAATGLFVEEEQDIDVSNVQVEVDDNAADEDGEDQEVFSENGDGSESEDGGATTDGEEGPPYECDDGFQVADECPTRSWTTDREGIQIAHQFECGNWFIGTVLRKVTCSIDKDKNGRYATKYPDSRKEYFHDLFEEDYGVSKVWVHVIPMT